MRTPQNRQALVVNRMNHRTGPAAERPRTMSILRFSVWSTCSSSLAGTELLELRRHPRQLTGRLLRVGRTLGGVLRGLATAVMFWAISAVPLAASPMLRLISLVVAVCSSTALAMVFEMSLIWLMIVPICSIASTAPWCRPGSPRSSG